MPWPLVLSDHLEPCNWLHELGMFLFCMKVNLNNQWHFSVEEYCKLQMHIYTSRVTVSCLMAVSPFDGDTQPGGNYWHSSMPQHVDDCFAMWLENTIRSNWKEPGDHFTKGLWAYTPNLLKKIHKTHMKLMMGNSDLNFVHVTTAELSWHVENCDLIALVKSILEQAEFSQGFDIIKCQLKGSLKSMILMWV